MIKIYTDGSSLSNPGPGGWGAVMLDGSKTVVVSGYNKDTTNNRMELEAMIHSVKLLLPIKRDKPIQIEIVSDSKYLVDGTNKWLDNWIENNWKPFKKNKDLWLEIDSLRKIFDIKCTWVKGHSGDTYNELADQLAVSAAQNAVGVFDQVTQ